MLAAQTLVHVQLMQSIVYSLASMGIEMMRTDFVVESSLLKKFHRLLLYPRDQYNPAFFVEMLYQTRQIGFPGCVKERYTGKP
ncbi:hypothetical protein D3C87_2041780 [compost metagenome]